MDKEIILNFGDSQGEIWDYVFFANDNYIKYNDNNNIGWRSGWSIRGIKKLEHQKRLFHDIQKLYKKNKKIIILLTFGSTDIEWNLSFKRFVKNEFPDTQIFINEMIDNLIYVINNYFEIEKKISNLDIQVIICFAHIPLYVSDEYMLNFSKRTNSIYYKVIDHKERISLWNNYCDNVIKYISNNYSQYKKKLHIFDLRSSFIQKRLNYFSRKDCEDHHPDLSISHLELTSILDNYLFYDNNNIPFKIKYNNWKFDFMYPHIRRPLLD